MLQIGIIQQKRYISPLFTNRPKIAIYQPPKLFLPFFHTNYHKKNLLFNFFYILLQLRKQVNQLPIVFKIEIEKQPNFSFFYTTAH